MAEPLRPIPWRPGADGPPSDRSETGRSQADLSEADRSLANRARAEGRSILRDGVTGPEGRQANGSRADGSGVRRRRSPGTEGSRQGSSRRVGSVSYLEPARPQPARSLGDCLEALRKDWERDGAMAALWQAWPRIAGVQLAPHGRPLSLQGGVLTVGAAPGPWLQALQYNRHQLLGALRGAGFPVREVRVRQHYPQDLPPPGSAQEANGWARHPSRIDVHGLADCPACGRPAPAGEMGLWGHCSFCRRNALADQGIDGSPNW